MRTAHLSWPAVVTHVAARHPVIERRRDWLLLGWPASGPRQTVQLKWGENNFFTWAEVSAMQIGKWNNILEKA